MSHNIKSYVTNIDYRSFADIFYQKIPKLNCGGLPLSITSPKVFDHYTFLNSTDAPNYC